MLKLDRVLSKFAVVLMIALPACVPVPDMTGVGMSFSSNSTVSTEQPSLSKLAETTFGQTIKEAIENSPTIAQSNTNLEISSANVDAAKGAFLPQVSLGVNARSDRIDSNVADVTPFLRVSQLVYDGGAAKGDLTAAKARALESRDGTLQTASAVALSAIEAYVIVLDQRQILNIMASNVDVHSDLVQQITERSAQGVGSTADVLTARSRMADAQTRFADAKANADRANAQFKEVFGYRPGKLSPRVEAPELSRTDRQIIEESPQVRIVNAMVFAAKAEQAAALARRHPNVQIAAFADRDDSNDANFGVDLSFNYEIDSTGQRRASIAAANARVLEAEFMRENLIREIRRELDFIRSDQQAGAERLKAARVAVQANADSVAAAREQFTIGRRSMIEILDAQRDYVNAQERLIRAEQNYFLTNYAIHSLTGDILDMLGVSVSAPEASQ